MPTSIAINPMRYPTLYMYLVKLPQGINSYPEAQTLADLPIAVLLRWPDLIVRPDLPVEVTQVLQQPLKPGSWVPEVIFMAINALVRDVIYRNDEGYLQFCYDTMRTTYDGPLMRTVMRFVSPSLLAMGASKRWAMVRRGTEMSALKAGKEDLSVKLCYPEYMFHRCMLQGFARSFQAGIDGTRARNCTVDVEFVSAKECRFHAKWNFIG